MTPSEKYTAAAYLVVFVAVLGYVVIIAAKLQRLQREVARLVELAREQQSRGLDGGSKGAEVPAWPAPEREQHG
ncbi:MAG TPA: CcmD family protein [Gaiellaceae bacterium]